MRFRYTITGEYEIDDDRLEDSYGTTDPDACAAIDANNLREDPDAIQFFIDDEFTVTVEPLL
jgi:hypothetical protein